MRWCLPLLGSALMALEVPRTLLAFPGNEDRPGGTAVVVATGMAVALAEVVPPGDGPWTLMGHGGRRVQATLIERRRVVRLAVPDDLPVHALARQEPALGATIWTWGNAAGAIGLDGQPAVSQGTISGHYDLPPGPLYGRGGERIEGWTGPVLEVDAAVNDGGGVVLDEEGGLVGLLTVGVARERRIGTAVRLADLGVGEPLPAPPAACPAWLAQVAFQRPQAPEAPVPRPHQAVEAAPAYERSTRQAAWDSYWHAQQIARRDLPAPALLVGGSFLMTAAGHLHGGATDGTALLPDGRTVPVQVVAVDVPMDLALLKAGIDLAFPDPPWRTAPLDVQTPIAVWGRHGALTRTQGRVAVVGRRLAQSDEGFLQVDARSNYGSLGGVLTDAAGSVAGVVVHLAPENPWVINSGVTLAVAAPDLRAALSRLTHGTSRVRRPILGLGIVLHNREDALVIREIVPGTGAAEAGLAPGDILHRVDGRPATSRAAVARALVRHQPGARISVEVLRNRVPQSITIELRAF